MKQSKWTVISIFVLALLLIGAVGYIVFDKYQEKQLEQEVSIYREGMQAGYQQAVIQLYQQASTCQQVPIQYENQTLNIVAVKCLQS
ncbi:MAG: hypothetical protein ACP5D2_02410 [Candidatus Nanoarchaeia archaeon]